MFKTLLKSSLLALFLQTEILSAFGQQQDQPVSTGWFREKVKIHTDRDFYIAGERLYFRLDVLSVDNRQVSGLAYLVLRNRNNTVIERSSSRVESNICYGSIYLPDTLSSGVYQLVAFTNLKRNFGEEHYATKQIVVVNRFDEKPDIARISYPDLSTADLSPEYRTTLAHHPVPDGTLESGIQDRSITIRALKQVYSNREKVLIELTPSGFSGSFASFAISVAQKQTLLHDHSCKRLPAGNNEYQIASNRGKSYFFKETDGPVITGQVVDRSSRKGIPEAMIILTTPDTVLNLLYAKTLDDGTFHFRLNDYHEGKELYISVYERDISTDADIRIIGKFSLEHPFEPGIIPGEGLSADFIRTSQYIARINKALNIDHHEYIETERDGSPPEIYSSPEYIISSFREYEYLENMHEIARELLPVLMVRIQDGQYTSRMALQFRGTYTRILPPVYFLDGIYTDDINRIIHLDSDDLESLQLHNHYWRMGDIMFPGIVGIFSTNQAYRNMKLSDPSVSIENHPTTARSVYNPPDYEKDSVSDLRPDFRQLLFWDPAVIIENDGSSKIIEFFTGDLKGEFIISANGYTDAGEIISEKYSIIIDDNLEEIKDSTDYQVIYAFKETGAINRRPYPEETGFPDYKVPVARGNADDPDRYFEQGLSGKLSMPPRQPIGNQHYPVEEWLSGSVTLENGIVVKNKMLRYNGYIDELFWLFEGDYQQIQVDKYFVKKFHLHVPRKEKPLIFHRIKADSPILIGRDEIFGELLYEGDVRLYAYRRIEGSRSGEYWIGDVPYGGPVISPRPLYILMLSDGTPRIIQRIRRRNILNLFHENRGELRGLLRENSLFRLRKEHDMIETARILDAFLKEN